MQFHFGEFFTFKVKCKSFEYKVFDTSGSTRKIILINNLKMVEKNT